jgi:beta-lactamase regulating signal transducer with metallopeptidase domain
MNYLGIALIWLAVQVTVLALAGLGLTKRAARQGPGAGASTALTTLLAAAVLVITAVWPLPSWWTWEPESVPHKTVSSATGSSGGSAPPPSSAETSDSSPGGGLGLSGLLSTLKDLVRVQAQAGSHDHPVWGWPATVAAIAAAGVFLGLLRLMLGILAIRRGLRNGRPVMDSALLDVVEELRGTLNIKRHIKVQEWSNLNTAATVGWRRPVLLLPAGWRDWNSEQRRAVIAHELVHVARSDFAGALLAQLSLVLHFWHPLVHLLVRQFQVQQELATDAVAAPVAGGRTGYLRALAALALRSNGRAHGWPAPALLSPKGTLLRRVEMLRFAERSTNQPILRPSRRLTVGAICGLALFVSALRAPVQRTLAETTPKAAAAAQAQVMPFDLSLLSVEQDKEAIGTYGIRPAALFNRPGTEPWRRDLDGFIDQFGKPLALGRFGIHVEDVEQVMGRIYVRGENKPGKRALMFSINAFRTTRDMDWVKLRDQSGTKLKQHQWNGETYVSFALPPVFVQFAGGGKSDGYFWAPDARTVIFDTEDNIKRLIEAKLDMLAPVTPSYAAGWDRLSRGLLVVALDKNTPQALKVALLTRTEIKEGLKETEAGSAEHDLLFEALHFCKSASQVVFGCAGGDDFKVDLWASADTPDQAGKITRSCETALVAARKVVIEEKAEDSQAKTADTALLHFIEQLLSRAAVRRDGNVVTVHADVPSGFNALLSLYAKGGNKGE